eukprot:scaffold3559_cov284-Chaetoceros_neogracile.AAC.23
MKNNNGCTLREEDYRREMKRYEGITDLKWSHGREILGMALQKHIRQCKRQHNCTKWTVAKTQMTETFIKLMKKYGHSFSGFASACLLYLYNPSRYRP